MIGGIIILTLFLTALTTMVVISQQYDAYQTTLNAMSQMDVERFSENLAVTYPGISMQPNGAVSGCGGTCNTYNLTISNLSGVGTQVARIYINSTAPTVPFYVLYILDPSPTPCVGVTSCFESYDSFVDPGAANHQIIFWLSSSEALSFSPLGNSISIVTERGRVFSFEWPFPPATEESEGPVVGGAIVPTGNTVDMGPFRISYDYNLITYTTNAQTLPGPAGCADSDPSPTSCMSGGWVFPSGTGIVFYVRIFNLGSANIILLDKSALVAHSYSSLVTDIPFYISGPMSQSCWNGYFDDPNGYYDGSWPGTGNCPTPGSLAGYNATHVACKGSPCYVIPQGSALGSPPWATNEEYVLFSANGIEGTTANQLVAGSRYEVTLNLFYIYQGSSSFEYSIALPLLDIST
jgi:hypothetical protein